MYMRIGTGVHVYFYKPVNIFVHSSPSMLTDNIKQLGINLWIRRYSCEHRYIFIESLLYPSVYREMGHIYPIVHSHHWTLLNARHCHRFERIYIHGVSFKKILTILFIESL